MVLYGRINVFEGIDISKTSASKEWNVCHYWYFLDKRYKFDHMYAMGVMMYWWCLWTLAIFLF